MAEKTESIEDKLARLEKRAKRQRNLNCIEFGTRATGAAIAGGAFYKYLGDTACNFGEFCGEVVDGARTVKAFASLGTSDETSQRYIDRLSPEMAEAYKDSAGSYWDLTTLGLESAQRASENFPGAQSEIVQGVRAVKGAIIQKGEEGIEWIGSWITGDDTKSGDAAKTNTPKYQINYNELGALRIAGVKEIKSLEGQINKHCERMSINESKTGKPDDEGMRILNGLVTKHNNLVSLVKDSKDLSVQEVNQGVNDTSYQAIISEAKDYGIQPIDYTSYGTNALIAGTILAVYLGNRLGKAVVGVPVTTYRLGTLAKDAGEASYRFVSDKAAKIKSEIWRKKA